MSSTHWEEFYANHLPPADFEDNRTLLKEFCDRHNEDQNSIVLVTVCSPIIISRILCTLDVISWKPKFPKSPRQSGIDFKFMKKVLRPSWKN